MQLVVVVAIFKGLGMHRFSLRLVCGDWYDWLLSSYLVCILFIFCCPKFKLLLRFLTIVTICRFKMLYFEPFSLFYCGYTLDLYSLATGMTSWAGRTVLIPEPNFCCGRWVWLILSGDLILKCGFLHEFLLHSSFYGWYDWLCRSYLYYIVF